MAVSLQLVSWIAMDAMVMLWWLLDLFVLMCVMAVNHVGRNVPVQYPGQDLYASCPSDKTNNQNPSRSFP